MKQLTETTRQGINYSKGPAKMKIGPDGNGATIFGKKDIVEQVIVPISDNARSRTIRLHEILHANNSQGCRKQAKKYKVSSFTAQVIEDCFVHLKYWPSTLPKFALRDAAVVSLQDLRTMKHLYKGKDITSEPNTFNGVLYTALRSYAILVDACPKHYEYYKKTVQGLFNDTKLSTSILKALSTVVNFVINNKRKDALRLFESLLMKVEEEESNQGEPGHEIGEESKGDKSDWPMRIEVFPLVERTSSEHMEILPVRSGSRLITSRLPVVLATKNLTGLFERERFTQGGGAILIDASGSMQPSFAELEKLCKLAPGATVAYYNGTSKQSDGTYGTLWIFAKDGMRADHLGKESLWARGNCVDLYALSWLLNQEGPHYFVTDEGFCGGPRGQDVAAKLLLARSPHVEVIKKLDIAIGVFEKLKLS